MGGSAGNASHMVNDLRKICNIEAYAPTDNVSEFSASCNDEGLGSYFPRWLTTSGLKTNDAIFILSNTFNAISYPGIEPKLVK